MLWTKCVLWTNEMQNMQVIFNMQNVYKRTSMGLTNHTKITESFTRVRFSFFDINIIKFFITKDCFSWNYCMALKQTNLEGEFWGGIVIVIIILPLGIKQLMGIFIAICTNFFTQRWNELSGFFEEGLLKIVIKIKVATWDI